MTEITTKPLDNDPVIGTCALCDTENMELRESHIIPRFVYLWLKETSSTPFIRSNDDVNIRHQDGEKTHLLCSDCETKFSGWENELAKNIFKKIANYQAQSSLIKVTAATRLAVLSIFWRALYASSERENDLTGEDLIKRNALLADLKLQLRNEECSMTIYFAPFSGEAPYYSLPIAFTYQIERGIGGQDIRFFDDPHRFYAVFKLPFMFFYIFSDGWSFDTKQLALVFNEGELNIKKHKEIPPFLTSYIHHLQAQFDKKKQEMDATNRKLISAEAAKNKYITGSDKSLSRMLGISVELQKKTHK